MIRTDRQIKIEIINIKMIKRALLKKREVKKELPKEPEVAHWVKPVLYTEKATTKKFHQANVDGSKRFNRHRDW